MLLVASAGGAEVETTIARLLLLRSRLIRAGYRARKDYLPDSHPLSGSAGENPRLSIGKFNGSLVRWLPQGGPTEVSMQISQRPIVAVAFTTLALVAYAQVASRAQQPEPLRLSSPPVAMASRS